MRRRIHLKTLAAIFLQNLHAGLLIIRKLRIYPRISIAVIASLIVIQAMILTVNATRQDAPILGLRLDTKTISQLQGAALKQQVKETVAKKIDQPLIVKTVDYERYISPRQLGARLDEATIMKRVLQQGRDGNILKSIIDQDAALLGQRSIPLGFSAIDPQIAGQYLQTVSQAVNRAPSSASLSLSNGHVAVTPDHNGTELLVNESLAIIASSHTDLTHPTTLVLPTISKPAPVASAQLLPFVDEAQKVVSKPMQLTAGDRVVDLSPDQILQLLEVKQMTDPTKPTQQKPALSFNEAKINAVLDSLADQVNVNGQPHIVSGRRELSPGRATASLNGPESKTKVISELLKRQLSDQPASQSVISLPVETTAPPTVNQYDTVNPLNRYPLTKDGHPAIYLTFDDGPGGYTEQTLDILKRYNVRSTFFLVGKNVAAYPATVKRIAAEGHTIGNHSYSHTDLSHAKPGVLSDEITRTQNTIRDTTGVLPILFRPPYGAANAPVLSAMSKANLSLMMWNLDPRDWSKPGSAVITKRVLDAARPGSVVVLHSIHQQTTEALPSIIEGLRRAGFSL